MIDNLVILVGFCCGGALSALCITLGFKMGRRTQGQEPTIKQEKIKNSDKDKLDGPDIFSEAVNDGLEGDPNERLRTM